MIIELAMYLSENPRRDGCNESETEMSHHNDDGLKVKSRDNRTFDIKAFHQLRLELLESQRIVNQERMKRQVLRSPPRVRLVVGSTFRSPSVVDFPSSTDVPQTTIISTGSSKREAFGASEAYDDNNLSFARQELLRLGRRYASYQETPPLTTHANYTGSLDFTRDARQALFPETTFLASPMRASGLDAQMSTKGIGIPGFYLLLARTHFPPNHENNDDEDGSASESYCTPSAPHLDTSSDKDVSYDQQDGTKFDHYFSSFCAAHLLRSELEDKLLKPLRRTDHEYLMQQQKRKMNYQRIKKIIKVSSIALAVLFCWCNTLNWSTHTQLDTISVQYSACYQSMQHSYWSMKTRFEERVDQLLCLREHNTTLHLSPWPKHRRINPVSVFTEWRQHIDRISCIIQSVYRIQKGYQDALAIASAAKYKCLGARRYAALTATETTKHYVLGFRQIPLIAWNSSLAFFSALWRSLTCAELADTSHRFEPHQFGRSLLTSPVLNRLDDDDVSIFGQNDTMWLLDCAEVAEPAIGTMFWRKSIKLPFLRKQSPLNRQSYLHSIPSFEAVQADSSDLICSVPLPSKMNKRGNTHQLILLSRPRFILKNPRLEGIAISLEKIQKNVSASRIMSPRRINNFKAIASTVKRDYYESSYPFAEQSEEKNIFEDVDVMNMMHEFIGNVLHRQLARRTVEYGIPMKHSL